MASLLLLLLTPIVQTAPAPPSPLERQAGWVELFDGETLRGWHSIGREGVRTGEGAWEALDGWLHLPPGGKGGDLVTDGEYGDFELELEWRVAPGANSGIKYRVRETPGMGAMLGPEYQVLDDAAHPDGGGELTSATALYALHPPTGKLLRPAGEVNRTRIVARGERLEHWLNGVRVVECTVGSDDWEARREASKFAPHADFGRGRGRIGLQDHGDEVWFRAIRLRDLEHLPGTPVELFDGATLAGWKALGDARWSVDDGELLGEVGGGSQSFLVTGRAFGDFLLEVELKSELPGNSGIQVRSHVNDAGRVYGYQVEIDPSERAWSGGLYDEGRRAWLDDLSDNEPARAAFRPGAWNRYRIECLGPWIRTWVNGVPAADWLDPLDLEGLLGLQVHSGNNTRVRWRDFRLRDLGTRSWIAVDPTTLVEEVDAEVGLDAEPPHFASHRQARLVLPEGEGAVRLGFRLQEGRHTLRGGDLDSVRVQGGGTIALPLGPDALLTEERPRGQLVLSLVANRLAAHLDGELLRTHLLPPSPPAERSLVVLFGVDLELEAAALLGPPE